MHQSIHVGAPCTRTRLRGCARVQIATILCRGLDKPQLYPPRYHHTTTWCTLRIPDVMHRRTHGVQCIVLCTYAAARAHNRTGAPRALFIATAQQPTTASASCAPNSVQNHCLGWVDCWDRVPDQTFQLPPLGPHLLYKYARRRTCCTDICIVVAASLDIISQLCLHGAWRRGCVCSSCAYPARLAAIEPSTLTVINSILMMVSRCRSSVAGASSVVDIRLSPRPKT